MVNQRLELAPITCDRGCQYDKSVSGPLVNSSAAFSSFFKRFFGPTIYSNTNPCQVLSGFRPLSRTVFPQETPRPESLMIWAGWHFAETSILQNELLEKTYLSSLSIYGYVEKISARKQGLAG
jgi:hypothetical protein